jgi:hypothetical protein
MYSGGRYFVSTPEGNVVINGVPVIGVKLIPYDKALIVDLDFIERLETEFVSIEFSYKYQDILKRM